MVEKIGRRRILIWGAAGMVIMQFIVGAIGATAGKNTTDHPANPNATRAMIAFICLNISVFATTWGPAAWIVIGEIFPLTIRSVSSFLITSLSSSFNYFSVVSVCPLHPTGMSTSHPLEYEIALLNFHRFWNCIIGVITPYLVADRADSARLGSNVFFMWGGLCCISFLFAYFLVPETKGLTLEQVDKMLEETTPRTSRKWKPHSTFAAEMHLGEKHLEIPVGTENVNTKTETSAV